MTELLRPSYQGHFFLRVEQINELGAAGAFDFPGLVKSPNLVVGHVGHSERDEYCSLVLALWYLQEPPSGSLGAASDVYVMLLLSAAYVCGCAFRSILPRADVQRICLFDTWLSSVTLGRSVATVAEICFATQWAIILRHLGTMVGANTTLSAAWAIVPFILIAECFSWHGVLTKNYLSNAIENSIWAISFIIVGLAFAVCGPSLKV